MSASEPVSLHLTAEQKAILHGAAGRWVAAAVLKRPAEAIDPTLGGTAAEPVIGVFVTLKRRGQLRGCCGSFGRPVPLSTALEEAAIRTATSDFRMPSISPTELEYLDLSVSVLHSARELAGRGRRRVAGVEIGRQGLQIVRGKARGLLLPVVAVEHRLDAERFLEQVCLKAGLPRNAWLEDDARLMTFESVSYGAPLDKTAIPPDAAKPPPLLAEGEIDRLAEFCRLNMIARLEGAVETRWPDGCTDGDVVGAALLVHLSNEPRPIHVGRLSLRPEVPLRAMLVGLVNNAAAVLRGKGYRPGHDERPTVGLAVLYDPAMHGTVARPDLRGIDPKRRAVLVRAQSRAAWLLDPDCDAETVLRKAVAQLRPASAATTVVYSAEVASTDAPVMVVGSG